MVNPNCFTFYTFAYYIHPLAELRENDKLSGDPFRVRMLSDANLIAGIFQMDDFCRKYLPSSSAQIKQISAFIMREIFARDDGIVPDTISGYVEVELREQTNKFETILQDELSKLPIFCCDDDKIGNFSIQKLLKGASNGYPNKTRLRLTASCRSEIDEAGKCLVYERSTAAGFHILRSVELTIRQYLMAIPGFVMPPLNRQNWGEYLDLLKKNQTAKEVYDHLYNIKTNYRNPLMHPEDTLEIDEAVSLFAVAQSMNEMLIADMFKRNLLK